MNKLRRKDLREITDQLETLQELLDESDAVYVVTSPDKRAWYSQKALEQKKHVLCESPVALEKEGALFLTRLAKEKGGT